MGVTEVSVIYNGDKVALGPHQRVGLAARRPHHVSVPPPDFQRGAGGWRLNQSPIANELISQACVMSPP